MHGGLVAYRLLVEAGVLPDGVVLAPGRRALRVVHGPLGVPACRTDVELLDPTRRAAR
jgi:hypothetical protein